MTQAPGDLPWPPHAAVGIGKSIGMFFPSGSDYGEESGIRGGFQQPWLTVPGEEKGVSAGDRPLTGLDSQRQPACP